MSDNDDKFENFTEEENYILDTEPTMGFFQRVIGIIVKPSETMEDINRKTKVLPVLITIVLFTTLSVIGTFGPMKDSLIAQYQTMGIDASQMDQMVKIGAISASVMAIAFSLLIPLIKAAFSHMISAIFDCDGTFGKTFAVVAYSFLIIMLGSVVKLPIVILTNNYTFDFNAAIFLPATSVGTPMYTALSLINVFAIWYLGVTIIGLKKVHKYSTGKAAVAALIPWLVYAGVTIGAVVLTAGLVQY